MVSGAIEARTTESSFKFFVKKLENPPRRVVLVDTRKIDDWRHDWRLEKSWRAKTGLKFNAVTLLRAKQDKGKKLWLEMSKK